MKSEQPKFWYAYNRFGILRHLLTEDDIKAIDKKMSDHFEYEVAAIAKCAQMTKSIPI